LLTLSWTLSREVAVTALAKFSVAIESVTKKIKKYDG
jgi:hypothetical protein